MAKTQPARLKFFEALVAAHQSDTVIYSISNSPRGFFAPRRNAVGGGGDPGTLRKFSEETGGATFFVDSKNGFKKIFDADRTGTTQPVQPWIHLDESEQGWKVPPDKDHSARLELYGPSEEGLLCGQRIAIVSLLVLVLTASAQDFQIRTRVDLVVVPVTVKASGDKLINGLQKEDFIVFEDGRRQTITNFTSDPVPLSAAVVLDTGLAAESLSKVQQTFPALAGAFSEFDEVAVYRFDKDVVKLIDFTKDQEALQSALNHGSRISNRDTPQSMLRGGPFSTIGPVINGAPVIPPGQLGVIVTQVPEKIKVLNDALYAAASDLAKRERDRRKIVLVVSDGLSNGSTHSFEETLNSLARSGVEVYAVTLDQTVPYTKIHVAQRLRKEYRWRFLLRWVYVQSIETGYARAAEQARNQYVLGYISRNTRCRTRASFPQN